MQSDIGTDTISIVPWKTIVNFYWQHSFGQANMSDLLFDTCRSWPITWQGIGRGNTSRNAAFDALHRLTREHLITYDSMADLDAYCARLNLYDEDYDTSQDKTLIHYAILQVEIHENR